METKKTNYRIPERDWTSPENWDAFENGEAPCYADLFTVIEYVNGKPSTYVGTFESYEKACDECCKDLKEFVKFNNRDVAKEDRLKVVDCRNGFKSGAADYLIAETRFTDKNRTPKPEDETYQCYVFPADMNQNLAKDCIGDLDLR